jgi:hypothetical protein
VEVDYIMLMRIGKIGLFLLYLCCFLLMKYGHNPVTKKKLYLCYFLLI